MGADSAGNFETRLVPDALQGFPGAALVVGADGRLLAANEAAKPLREPGRERATSELVRLAGAALSAGQARAGETLVIARDQGPQIFDVAVLPLVGAAVLVLARDVTLDRNLRAALIESRQRYKDLVEVSSDFAWEVGADGCFVFVSAGGSLGYAPDDLVGRAAMDFVLAQPASIGPSPFRPSEPVIQAEVWMRCADGAPACLVVSSVPLVDGAGEWRGARGVCRDVTSARARDAALARAHNRERLISYIVRTIRDVLNPADMLSAAAEAIARALGAVGCQIFRRDGDGDGFVPGAAYGTVGDAGTALAGLAGKDYFEGLIDNRHVLAGATRHRHTVNGAICLWRDADRLPWNDDDRLMIDDMAVQIAIANEQIANHERILALSRTDPLTGLFNRRAFYEELGRRFARLAREGRPAALIFADLDNFKLVNDVHGHQLGDEALLAVRDLLVAHTRPVDLVARLGGDEFAVWLEGAEEKTAVGRTEAIIEAAADLDRFSGAPESPLHLSLGLAVYDPCRPEGLEGLLARADKAMYAVKRGGKGAWRMAPANEEGGH